jgi:tetratricopeptide (TPR) repeat protein
MSRLNWLEILGWTQGAVDDLRYVGFSYIQQGIYDVALSFFEAVAVLSPPNAYDFQTIGALHLQLGDLPKALQAFDKALELDPSHLPTQLNRAKALFSLGHRQQAVRQAQALIGCPDADISSAATALLLGYK